MLYNLLIDWQDQTDESGIIEPISIAEVKQYLRLEGFIDSTESLSSEFDDDDQIISDLITSARERLENYTGLSFIPKTMEIEFTNLNGNFEIPFGPVNEINYLRDDEGDSLSTDEYKTSFNLKVLKYPKWPDMTMNYEAGYVVLPKGLKDAMYKEIAYRYINRGEENIEGLSKDALILASKYKTDNWIG